MALQRISMPAAQFENVWPPWCHFQNIRRKDKIVIPPFSNLWSSSCRRFTIFTSKHVLLGVMSLITLVEIVCGFIRASKSKISNSIGSRLSEKYRFVDLHAGGAYFISSFKMHDDVIKWKHFPRYWPFVPGIHRSRWIPLHKGQWRGALIFSMICAWTNDWVNNCEAGDLRRHRGHYDANVMGYRNTMQSCSTYKR